MLNFANPSVDQLFAATMQHHLAGRMAEAERGYRQILAQAPRHADAWHMLGVLACQLGKPEAARDLIEKAIALNPQHAAYRSNLGEACRMSGQLPQAEAHFNAAITMNPRMADAYTNLAALYAGQERFEESLQAAQQVLAFMPENAVALRFLGDAHSRMKRPAEALAAYQRSLALDPKLTDARFNAGLLLVEAGRLTEGEAAFRRVVADAPEDWDARLQLAEVLDRLGRTQEAYQELTTLVQRNPHYAKGYAKLANVLRNANRVDEALAAYAQAMALDPGDWVAHANMSFALRDQARLEEALAIQRAELAKHPDAVALHSGLIFTMQLVPGLPPAELLREQNAWNRRHGDPVAGERGGFPNARDPRRRLRVGYVSADLRSHSVGRFMLPLVQNHDRSQVEVICYQAGRSGDGVTRQIQAAADRFVPLGHLDDAQAAAQVRADGIDILVDLSNHTIDNRMPLFARKPAPVQMSYLAFSAGTGLETMDWRLTDPYIDPPGSADVPFEKPLYLAETYWCYAAHSAAGDVLPLPALSSRIVTFGGFNYFSKCNDQVLALWARLLAEIPGSRLMLHVPTGSREGYVRQLFESRGIAPERLILVGRLKEAEYFRNYGSVDIALDTFPWAGGTTTCDALWMGVPVVTLAGGVGATLQRCGVSILSNLGHPEWIATTPEAYIATARDLATDLPRLSAIRAGLRPKMRSSVLMDAPRFARNVEAAYRRAWESWCGQGV